MAHDPASDRMVMIGRSPGGLFTTWFYTFGAGWAAGPAFPAADARVLSDSVRGEAVLLTGGFPTVTVARLDGDAWETIAQDSGRAGARRGYLRRSSRARSRRAAVHDARHCGVGWARVPWLVAGERHVRRARDNGNQLPLGAR